MKTLDRTRGLVHDLIVTRNGGTITLWSAGGIRHTVFDSAVPHIPGLEYARNTLAALAFCPRAQSSLILGLGGGSIPRMLLAARPSMEVEAVEIDPAVVELAARYFYIHTLTRFALHLKDAASFLKCCGSRFGIIVVDTYIGERFPDQCATREFLQDSRKCLSDDGVLVVNWMSGDTQVQKMLLANIETTIGPVWQLSGLKTHNLLYFATARKTTRPELMAAAAGLEYEIPFESSLKRLVQRLRSRK
jgi:spermidine synthase